MTQQDRVERVISDWLVDAARPQTPDYFKDILAQTARTRQRPAWTFLERWLPVTVIARQRVALRPMPWRALGLVLLLIALLIAGLIAVGSGRRLPAPFGPAANGLVAYDSGGDIYTVDPTTGMSRAIVSGPETDIGPRWSRDGSRIVFERLEPSGTAGWLYVVRGDGGGLTKITPTQLIALDTHSYSFAPNGSEVVFVSSFAEQRTLSFAKSDGSGVRSLVPMPTVAEPVFRPTSGTEIAFLGGGTPGYAGYGLFVMKIDGTNLRTLVEPMWDRDLGAPSWSPDGSAIAYMSWWTTVDRWTVHTHVVNADGTSDRQLLPDKDNAFDGVPTWSNDGRRLVLSRGYEGGPGPMFATIVPVDGAGPVIESAEPLIVNGDCCTSYEWSPDDSQILATVARTGGLPDQQFLVEPATARKTPVSWPAFSDPAWQRLAP